MLWKRYSLCFRYKPLPGESFTESSLTVMKIQLPTGVEAYLEDLRQVKSATDNSPEQMYLYLHFD